MSDLRTVSVSDLDIGDLGEKEEEEEVLSETEIAVTDSRDSPVHSVNIARTVLDNQIDNHIEDNISNQRTLNYRISKMCLMASLLLKRTISVIRGPTTIGYPYV